MTPAELHAAALAAIAERRAETSRLREVAEGATPGPWTENVMGSEGYDVRANPDPSGNPMRRIRVAKCGYEKWETDRANATYIAAFDPPTMLALLDAFDRDTDALESVVLRHAPAEVALRKDCCPKCSKGIAVSWPCPDAAAVLRALLGVGYDNTKESLDLPAGSRELGVLDAD